MAIPASIAKVLSPAYPCPEFEATCSRMRWDPTEGHVPRGFYGATGELFEVELVLIVAEPGDPHPGETHSGIPTAYTYAGKCLREGRDLFHRNIRHILSLCWPEASLELQLRRMWLTESVLCSAKSEGAHVPAASARACGKRYLLRQLELFPSAMVVACGRKAQHRLQMLNFGNFLCVGSVAPPEGNKPRARESWDLIPSQLARHRSLQVNREKP